MDHEYFHKGFHISGCTCHSGLQAAKSFKLLKSLEETKDSIRSTDQRCYLVRSEVDILIEQVSICYKFCISWWYHFLLWVVSWLIVVFSFRTLSKVVMFLYSSTRGNPHFYNLSVKQPLFFHGKVLDQGPLMLHCQACYMFWFNYLIYVINSVQNPILTLHIMKKALDQELGDRFKSQKFI